MLGAKAAAMATARSWTRVLMRSRSATKALAGLPIGWLRLKWMLPSPM